MYLVRSVDGRDNFCVALFQVRAAIRLIEYTHLAPYPAQLAGPPTVRPQSLSAQQIHCGVRRLTRDDTIYCLLHDKTNGLSVFALAVVCGYWIKARRLEDPAPGINNVLNHVPVRDLRMRRTLSFRHHIITVITGFIKSRVNNLLPRLVQCYDRGRCVGCNCV